MRIERVLANNPGPFTGPGTNTWILDDGQGRSAVIDPGPIDPAHESAIIEALASSEPIAVLVTHTHEDHAPMANPLARDLGVPAIGYQPGPAFDPDRRVGEGDVVTAGDLDVTVVFTPGHSDDHLCFRVANVLFTGDHIMGGSSVMVESMGAYLDSLTKLKGTGLTRLLPGHGEEMDEPDAVIDWYVAHRLQRHRQIADAVGAGARTSWEVVEIVYDDVDSSLYPLAERSVRAHLALLSEEGEIAYEEGAIVPKASQ